MMNSVMFLSRVKYDCHVVSSEHDLWDRNVGSFIIASCFPSRKHPRHIFNSLTSRVARGQFSRRVPQISRIAA